MVFDFVLVLASDFFYHSVTDESYDDEAHVTVVRRVKLKAWYLLIAIICVFLCPVCSPIYLYCSAVM